MKDSGNPRRLLDSASPCSPLGRNLLQAARADAPSRRRTSALVAAALASAPVHADASENTSRIRPTQGAAVGVATIGKIVTGVGLAGCVAFFVAHAVVANGAPRPGVHTAPAPVALAANEQATVVPSPFGDRVEHEPPTVSVEDLPVASPSAPRRDELKAAPGVDPTSPPVEQASLEAELARLHAARDAIRRGAPQAALDELDGYSRQFPNGLLKPEAEALSIEAEVAAGRKARARADADSFLAAHADSPQAPRIRLIRDRLEP